MWRALRHAATPLAAGLLAGLISLAFLSAAPLQRALALNLGSADPSLLGGFYRGETDAGGRGLRWTDGDATIRLPAQGLGPHILALALSAPRPQPEPVALTVRAGGVAAPATLAPGERRVLLVLAPAPPPPADTAVAIVSATFVAAEATPRTLGVVAHDLSWSAAPTPWLPAAQAALIGLTAALLAAGLRAARAPAPLAALLLAMLTAIALAMRHSDARFDMRWDALLLSGAVALLLAALVPALWRWRPAPYPPPPARRWARAHAPALLGYLALTALLLGSLWLAPRDTLIGAAGDNYEYAWKVSWFVEALTGRLTSPVFSPQIYFPSPTELTNSEMTPANILLWLPVHWLVGPVAGYNLVVQASFVLTGLMTYLLAQRLGAPRAAAWVAGALFSFTLTRVNHAAEGHLGFLGSQWPLLALYGWEGLLRYRRTWDALVAALGLTLTCWSSWHYGTTLPVALLIYTLVRGGRPALAELARRPQPLLIGALIVVPLVAPLAQPYYQSLGRGDAVAHPYWELVLHAPTPLDYLLPSPYHPLWGAWAGGLYGRSGGEFLVAPGLAALALGLAGLWVGRRRPEARGLAAVALVALVFSLGPELRLGETAVGMPARWLYESRFPLYGDIRTWGRMGIYVALACALLASLALAELARRRWALALAGALALAELAVAMPLSPAQIRPVDLWLRERPGAGAVVQFPREPSGTFMFLTWRTGRPTSQGSGKYAPALYREERDTLFSFPDRAMLLLAQRWRIEYIIVDDAALERRAPGWRARALAEPLLREAYRADGLVVFEVLR